MGDLRGGGDPTLGDETFNRIWEDGQGPTAPELVRQLQRDGIRRVTGHVIADGSLFDARTGPPSSGFQPDIPDLGGQLAALPASERSGGAGVATCASTQSVIVVTTRRVSSHIGTCPTRGRTRNSA